MHCNKDVHMLFVQPGNNKLHCSLFTVLENALVNASQDLVQREMCLFNVSLLLLIS